MKKKYLVCLTCLTVVLALAIPVWPQGRGPMLVVVTKVSESQIAPTEKFVGTVMPLRGTTVGSAVSGRVKHFLVNEGDRVVKGQPLAVLRTKTIRAEHAAAQAELNMRLAELRELKNGSRPEEIEIARAKVAVAKARVDYRQSVNKRTQAARTGVSAQTIEETVALFNEAEAEAKEAAAALKLAVNGPRQEKIDQVAAKADSQKAIVDRIQERIDRHTMYAPFDGYIVAEHAEVGKWLLTGDPVIEIAELHQVEIEVSLPENYVRHVRVGELVDVELGALPNQRFRGWVSRIVPQANVRARTFPIKIRVPNRLETTSVPVDPILSPTTIIGLAAPHSPRCLVAYPIAFRSHTSPLLKSGMFARVSMPIGKRQKAVLIPRDALVFGSGKPIVYVVDVSDTKAKTGKARAVPVKLGSSSGDRIQVVGDVRPGDHIVVQGNVRLRPGLAVRMIPQK